MISNWTTFIAPMTENELTASDQSDRRIQQHSGTQKYTALSLISTSREERHKPGQSSLELES